jgi:poly(hydroxyalkanoate) granule-associated protein
MPQADERKGLQDQLRDVAVDVRNEVIVQSANLYLMARRVLLTSLGAVALSYDEGDEFLNKLTERGEVAETDLVNLVNDFVARSNEREAKAMDTRRSTIDKAAYTLADSVEVILGRLNVPTKGDLEELSRKISKLNERVLALRQRNMETGQLSGQGLPNEPAAPAASESSNAQTT